jgi:hypothetical protein
MRYSRLQNSDTHMINIGMSPAHELKMELNYPQQRVKCQWKWGEVPYSHRYGQYLEHSHPQCGCLPSSFYLFWLGRMMSPTSFTHLYPNFARWKKNTPLSGCFLIGLVHPVVVLIVIVDCLTILAPVSLLSSIDGMHHKVPGANARVTAW